MEKHIDFTINGLGQNLKMFVQHIKCIDFTIEMEKHMDFKIKGLGQNFKMFVQHIKCIDCAIEVEKLIDFAERKSQLYGNMKFCQEFLGPRVLMGPKY